MVNKEIKEKKSGFNIVDFIILLFIILAAVGIAMKYNLANKISMNTNEEKFEVEFITGWAVQEASQRYFRIGVEFYVNVESLKIGEISAISDVRNPAVIYERDLRGNIVKTEKPGSIDIIGVMTSTGRITKDGEYMINGNIFVAPGKEFFIHTGEWEGTIRVMSVRKVGE